MGARPAVWDARILERSSRLGRGGLGDDAHSAGKGERGAMAISVYNRFGCADLQ